MSSDLGHQFKAEVTATNASGATPTLSNELVPPASTALPTISGTLNLADTLTATTGAWTNTPTSYAYQWLRDGAPISGETSSSHTIVTADTGRTLSVTVTASNAGGSTSADAAGVAVPPIPAVVTAPQISGVVASGATLSAYAGVWTGSPTLTYTWSRGASAISGATSSTYAIASGDVGHTIGLTVTATNGSGATSASDALTPPSSTSPPTISGSITVGQVLTATPGSWSHSPTTISYQWTRNASAISGETSATHTLVAADAGTALNIVVTATNADGTTPASAASDTTIPDVPANTTAPAISGSVAAGHTLSTTSGSWSGTPSSYSYQWQRDDVGIDGATSAATHSTTTTSATTFAQS